MLLITILNTNQNPFKNRKKARNQNDFANVEMTVKINDNIRAGTMTFFRPLVSAINPQKCDDKIIPIYPTEPNKPLCSLLKFNSHCAIGNITLMQFVSNIPQASVKPESTIIK